MAVVWWAMVHGQFLRSCESTDLTEWCQRVIVWHADGVTNSTIDESVTS